MFVGRRGDVQQLYVRPLDAVGLATLSTVTYSDDPIQPSDPIVPIGSVAFVIGLSCLMADD